MMTNRILVVDEQDLFRAGIAAVLDEHPDYAVHEALARPRHAVRQIAAVAPDLVIIDPFINDTDGPALLAEIRDKRPSLPLLILTNSAAIDNVNRALQLHVNGYMLKNSPAKDLLSAIESVLAGKTFLHPDVSHALFTADIGITINTRNGAAMLTVRQEQVLRMIADGKTTRQIATSLGLSSKTVESHRVTLMNRLGIHHIPGLVRYALRYGYANLEVANDA